METVVSFFMASVVGCLVWIACEVHSLKKQLKVKENRRNGCSEKPGKYLYERSNEAKPIVKPRA